MTPTLTVWHSNIFTQSLIAELTLNPGWHDWWPLSTHLTWGDIWVMGLSLRITVSHVCHEPSVVISCSMLIIQIIFSLQQLLQLKCKVNALQVRLPWFWATYFAELWQIYHNRHCVADIGRPVFQRALLLSLMSWRWPTVQCSLLTALSLATDWHPLAAT